MRIHGLTVSVNYADLLGKSIERWCVLGLDSLTIVTDLEDEATVNLANRWSTWCDNWGWCRSFRTDAFYRNGAHFNKGLAQQEAWPSVPKDGWVLLFDADITPPADWKQQVEAANPEPGKLYGCRRWDEQGTPIPDDIHGYGYFQLLHGSDPLAQADPFFDTGWVHAGCGDSTILLRWLDAGRLAPPLPIHLTHAGIGPSHNWYGKGKEAEFKAMEEERRRRGGGWKCLAGEVLPGAEEPALLRR